MRPKCRSTTSCATARHVPTHHAFYTLQNKLLSSTKKQHSRRTRTGYLLSPAARPRRRVTTTTLYNMVSILPQVVPLSRLFIGHWNTPKTAIADHHARSATWPCNCNIAHRNGALPRRSPPKTAIADRHARSATWPRNGNVTHHTRVLHQSLPKFPSALPISHLLHMPLQLASQLSRYPS